jgi:hypothetical protein
MNASWAGSGKADSELARELGLAAGFECNGLLMPHLKKTNPLLALG